MSNTSLGQQIRRARKESALTQSDLAKGIVTSSMICQIENGKAFPSYQVLQALAERLCRPIEFFVSDTDAHNRQRSSYGLAKALMAAGSYEKAYTLLKTVQEGSSNLDARELKTSLAECSRKLGHFDEANQILGELLTQATNTHDQKSMVQLLQRLGEIAVESGQYQLALYHWKKAHDLVDRVELEASERTRLLLAMGSTYYKLGYVEEAIPFFSRAYAEREESLSLEEIGQMLLNLSLSHRDVNDYEKASELSEQAYAIFKSVNNARLATEVRRTMAVLVAKQGDIDEALTMLGECHDTYTRTYDAVGVGITQIEKAYVLQLSGDLDGAIEQVQNALTMLASDDLQAARAHQLLADMYRVKRNLAGAIHHCNIAVQLFQKYGRTSYMIEALDLSVGLYQEWEIHRHKKYGTAITA
jgi:HTH-type transcriptional regulator, quorum sensing regulator NprR